MEQIASFAIYMLTITSITFILALSLDLQVGHCGIVNFGQVMFLVVGAYATAIAIAGGVGVVGATIIAVITSTLTSSGLPAGRTASRFSLPFPP